MGLGGRKAIWQTQLGDYGTTEKDALGSLRQEGDKFYKMVKNNHSDGPGTLDAGDAVYWYPAVGASTYAVTAVAGDSDGVGAGIVVASMGSVSTSTVNYFWILLKGQVVLDDTPSGTPADGDHIGTAAAGMKKMALVTDHPVGVLDDVSALLFTANFPL